MKDTTQVILATTTGTIAGAAVGAVFVPVNMTADLFAPITYPLYGLGATFVGSQGLPAEERVLMMATGTVTALALFPWAPVNFFLRPTLSPTLGAIIGGLAAYIGIKEQQKKRRKACI